MIPFVQLFIANTVQITTFITCFSSPMLRKTLLFGLTPEHDVYQISDYSKWCEIYGGDNSNRIVASSDLYSQVLGKHIFLSTAFIGISIPTFRQPLSPSLFETAISIGESVHFELICKYNSWQEAEAGHHKFVRILEDDSWLVGQMGDSVFDISCCDDQEKAIQLAESLKKAIIIIE